MEKKKVWRELTTLSEYELEGTIDEAISKLEEYRTRYQKDKPLRFHVVFNKWEEGTHLELQVQEDETDEEYNKRVTKEKKDQEEQIRHEKVMLQRLKDKYEKGDKKC